MKILIATPAPRGSNTGNRITAERWARIFRDLGHTVTVSSDESLRSGRYDLLVALHALKSAEIILEFRKQFPSNPIVVALTGTDLHRDLGRDPATRQSLNFADRIVLIEPRGKNLLDKSLQKKCSIILQSATPPVRRAARRAKSFSVSIIGHLRKEKDPFLIVKALNLLPSHSRIQVVHIGQPYNGEMKSRAQKAGKACRRYRWLGRQSHSETKRLLSNSDLTVLTSKIEGAPNVISEAIVCSTPVLTTEITATVGMLGEDYPGFFPVGDAERLAQLLLRCEREKGFLRQLNRYLQKLKPKFSPAKERRSWKELLNRI